MKKSFLVSLVAFFAIVTIIFFGSCADLADSSQVLDNSPSVQNGRATLSFSINAENARTITPSNLELSDITKITLQTEKMNESGEYEVIKKAVDTFWETNDTKTAYELLAAEKFVFDYGTYNFYLELYALSPYGDCGAHVVQTAELKGLAINEKTKNLEFESKFVEAGAVSLVFQLDAIEEIVSRMGLAEVTLHAIAENGSIGTQVEDTYKSYSFDEDALKEIKSDSGTKSVYQLNYILGDPIPNGDYWYKLLIYDKDDTEIVMQKVDIVRIKGYKTEKTIVLNPAEINILYNITYNLDSEDASWNDGVEEKLTTKRNACTSVTLPTNEDVSRLLGYKLVGWQPAGSSEILTEISAGTDSAQDYALYAKWIEADSLSLIYNNIEGINEELENPQAFKENEDVTLIESISKTGYFFGGWYTDKDFAEGTEITGWEAGDKTDNVTVYAKWTPITYTIKFDANNEDATGTMDPINATYDEKVTLPENGFTLLGYNFAGWAFEKDVTEIYYDDEAEDSNLTDENGATITLYAVWAPKDKLKLYYANIEGINETLAEYVEFAENESVTLPTVTKNGYAFEGWYDNYENDQPTGNKITGWSAGEKTEDLYVYAKWTAIEINPITVNMETFTADEEINLSYNEGTKTFSIGTEYASYAWLVDGLSAGSEATFTVDETKYEAGNHRILLVVKNAEGNTLTASGSFTVTK